jgi:hypothetical protein
VNDDWDWGGGGGKEEAEVVRGGVWILRIKFIGALGLLSEREKRPDVEVADGGKGCCGFTALDAFAPGGT